MKMGFLLFTFMLVSHAYAETSAKCPGEEGYYFTNYKRRSNPTAGGFVANTAFVDDRDDELFIAPTASVCGFASIEERASIRGNSLIKGNSVISGEAVIQGNIIIDGDSSISGKSRVVGNGILKSVTLKDETKTLTDANPFEVPAPTLSSYDIFIKLMKYIKANASSFTPNGHPYNGQYGGFLKNQEITFENNPCNMKILKDVTRTIKVCEGTGTSSLHAVKEYNIDLTKVTRIRNYTVNPGYSQLDFITISDYWASEKYWTYDTCNRLDNYDWHYFPRIDASIDAPSKVVADNIALQLSDLIKSCQK